MTFARGARVGSAAGDAEAFAVIDGQPFKVRADWRTARDGRRFLRLRFFPLREPPPREVAGR
jgi:hypothetical protein